MYEIYDERVKDENEEQEDAAAAPSRIQELLTQARSDDNVRFQRSMERIHAESELLMDNETFMTILNETKLQPNLRQRENDEKKLAALKWNCLNYIRSYLSGIELHLSDSRSPL